MGLCISQMLFRCQHCQPRCRLYSNQSSIFCWARRTEKYKQKRIVINLFPGWSVRSIHQIKMKNCKLTMGAFRRYWYFRAILVIASSNLIHELGWIDLWGHIQSVYFHSLHNLIALRLSSFVRSLFRRSVPIDVYCCMASLKAFTKSNVTMTTDGLGLLCYLVVYALARNTKSALIVDKLHRWICNRPTTPPPRVTVGKSVTYFA